MSSCPTFESLVDWWTEESSPAEGDRLEEHLFGCGRCAAELERIAALGAGVREAVRRGGVRAVVSPASLEQAARAGLRIREYRLAPGATVHCTVAPDDDLLVSRLSADLAGATRVDLVWLDEHGREERRRDLPFAVSAREVVWIEPVAEVRKLPATVQRARLLAVGDAGERVLGEYVFDHTPWR